MAKALITGITGQDGWYLAEHLLSLGYEVFGTRRPFSRNPSPEGVVTYDIDCLDNATMAGIIHEHSPDEIYNLAAQTHVGHSFLVPSHTMSVNILGLLHILEASRALKSFPKIYQASSSEIFGILDQVPANEWTTCYPVSPYGVAKLSAHKLAQAYRRRGMFVSNGIAFNHESPRRGSQFVTKRIVERVAAFKRGEIDRLEFGDLTAVRDWGDAREYVQAMHLILQLEEPGDYVMATGECASCADFLQEACEAAEIAARVPIVKNLDLTRPVDVPWLCGDARKLREALGEKCPIKTLWPDLAREMMKVELLT